MARNGFETCVPAHATAVQLVMRGTEPSGLTEIIED